MTSNLTELVVKFYQWLTEPNELPSMGLSVAKAGDAEAAKPA